MGVWFCLTMDNDNGNVRFFCFVKHGTEGTMMGVD